MLDHSIIGVHSDPVVLSWDSTESLLYSIGVGAGSDDPARELAFTTENCEGVPQRAIPTLAIVVTQREPARLQRRLGDFAPEQLVHAEQGIELFGELPPSGSVQVSSAVTGIYDKRSGALIRIESDGIDPATGAKLFSERSAVFIRGEGGFGGDREASQAWSRPDRPPDATVRYVTRAEQALLYRLTGDRNPLHSDPVFATRAGFGQPILHGLCTYGFAARAVLNGRCDGDPARLRSIHGRFTAAVVPGAELVTDMWDEDGTVAFQTISGDGTVVIDRGRATVR